MTNSKSYWWTRKSVERILTAAVVTWICALVADVILNAHTPVKGQFIASGITGGLIATAMYFGQKRKRKAPAKPQVEMPSWAPSMQTWYMGGILLLLVYLQVVTYGNSVGATWASAWLSFTASFSDLAAHVVPTVDASNESLVTHGYEDRVRIVRHVQAVSWIWLFLLNGYLVVWFIQRWNFTKEHVETQSNLKIIFVILFAFTVVVGFYFLLMKDAILYEDRSHSLFNLLHYLDSSLILNSLFFPVMFYVFFMLLLGLLTLIPARISNILASQE